MTRRSGRSTLVWELVAAGLILATGAANAQEQRRVAFDSGTSGATIEGSITGYEEVTYILGASAGQTMTVEFSPSNASANFNVFSPSSATAIFMGASGGHSFSGVLPATGDYRVQVYLMRNAARRNETARYTIRFGIAGASASAPAPDFADGQAGGPDFWQVSGVSGGDRLNLRAGPSTSNRVVARAANGTVLRNLGCQGSGTERWCQVATPHGSTTGWASGRYLVESAGPSGAASGVGGAAPQGKSPDIYQRSSGEFEVGWSSGCTVLYDPSGQRITAGSSCSAQQLAQSDAEVSARTGVPDGSATSGVDTTKAVAGCKAALAARTGQSAGEVAVVDTLWGEAGVGVTMTVAGSDKRWSCLSSETGQVQGLN